MHYACHVTVKLHTCQKAPIILTPLCRSASTVQGSPKWTQLKPGGEISRDTNEAGEKCCEIQSDSPYSLRGADFQIDFICQTLHSCWLRGTCQRCQDDKDIFFSTWTQISLSSACPSTFMPLSGLIQMSPGGETKTLAFDPQIAGRGRRSQGLTPWGGRECRALKEHVWF